MVNVKDFHNVYTSIFNPSLFVFNLKKHGRNANFVSEFTKNENKNEDLFIKVFSQPYHI